MREIMRSAVAFLVLGFCVQAMGQEWKLVWSDEFDYTGSPDPECWSFEEGFVRNHELQWYQEANAFCKDGILTIEGRKEQRKNPLYRAGSSHWKESREFIEYTSSSIQTAGKKEFLYGRFEVRARIPVAGGAWPAIWTLGREMEWPSNGEIDVMEYYRIDGEPHILANAAWGTEQRFNAKWNSKAIPFSYFTDKDPAWASKFHVWRMDWDEEAIRLYLDDELLNEVLLDEIANGSLGGFKNPFRQPHYLLLNLAIGGDNGGDPDDGAFPLKYEIDYVRVYQKEDGSEAFTQVNTITDQGAWCWFADPRALSYQNENGTINSTYVGYIDVHGNIKATQINHLTQTRDEVLVRSCFQPDDHNNPTFLVLPDERIMVFYSRHTDEACFYYRISQKPGDITTLGREVRLETDHNTTYPSPFILSDDPDHIYLCWRGIGWHPTIARLTLPDGDDQVRFVDGPHQIVRSQSGRGGVRPYAKYQSNGKDKIYMAYTTTHPDNQSINYIYFNAIDIHTGELKDVKGNRLGIIGKEELHEVDATQAYKARYPYAVVDDAPYRDWLWEIVMDGEEHPVIAMVRISEDKASHAYYYARWNGSEWKKTFLADAGGHFHQTPGLEKCYSGGMTIDKESPNIVYGSVPVEGVHGRVYELKKFVMAPDGELVSTEQLTYDSFKNNVRPYAVSGQSNVLQMVWMYGDYYDWIVSSKHPQGYPTAIHTNMDLSERKYSPERGDFSIALSVSVGSLRSGVILKTNTFSYGVRQGEHPKAYVKIGGNEYGSTNVLGNSDVWQTQKRGTGGEWYTPTRLDTFNLKITYEKGVLKTYINGWMDQCLEAEGLSLSGISFNEHEGELIQH